MVCDAVRERVVVRATEPADVSREPEDPAAELRDAGSCFPPGST